MKFRIIEDQSSGAVPQRFRKRSAAEEFADLPWYGKAAQAADDVVRGISNGLTLGYMDNIAGYLGGEGTETEVAKTRAAKERGGIAMDAANFLGMYGPASAFGRSALSATRMVPETLKGAKGLAARSFAMGTDGAALGAAQATNDGGDRITNALMGFAGGSGGNLAGEALTAGASKVFGALNKPVPTMSAEELKAAGAKAYADAENAGVIFRPEAVNRLRQTVYDDFAEFGFHPKNQPGAGVAYDELARLAEGGNVSLKGLDSARKIAQGGFNPTNPSNNALIWKATERIDDFAANATPDDILTGDPQAASTALKQARDYWSRFRKVEKVDELLDRAGLNAGSAGSGGNVENATRQQLKRILTDKKMMRGFTADEKAAVKKAVLGTNTQNALRLAGKLSPQGNGLMLALQGGLTAVNPFIGVPAMAVGYGAKKASEAMTSRNAELVKKLIAAGGKKSALEGPKNALQRLTEAQREPLIRALMAGGLVAAGQQ